MCVFAWLQSSMDESMASQRALGAALDEGRKRDGLVLRNQQLESARHFDRVAQDKELRRMHTEHNRQLAAMRTELSRISESQCYCHTHQCYCHTQAGRNQGCHALTVYTPGRVACWAMQKGHGPCMHASVWLLCSR
jgi:hypothetical protein